MGHARDSQHIAIEAGLTAGSLPVRGGLAARDPLVDDAGDPALREKAFFQKVRPTMVGVVRSADAFGDGIAQADERRHRRIRQHFHAGQAGRAGER